jgi:hypothetical protein
MYFGFWKGIRTGLYCYGSVVPAQFDSYKQNQSQ